MYPSFVIDKFIEHEGCLIGLIGVMVRKWNPKKWKLVIRVLNCPKCQYELTKIWQLGLVFLQLDKPRMKNKLKNNYDIGFYMSKYLGKTFFKADENEKKKFKKSYSFYRNCTKSATIAKKNNVLLINKIQNENYVFNEEVSYCNKYVKIRAESMSFGNDEVLNFKN